MTVHVVCLVRALYCMFIVRSLNCLVSLGASLVHPTPNRHRASTYHPSKVIAGLVLWGMGLSTVYRLNIYLLSDSQHSLQTETLLFLSVMACHILKRTQANTLYLSEFNLIACPIHQPKLTNFRPDLDLNPGWRESSAHQSSDLCSGLTH